MKVDEVLQSIEKILSSYQGIHRLQKQIQSQAKSNLEKRDFFKDKPKGFDYVQLHRFYGSFNEEKNYQDLAIQKKENQIVFINGSYSKEHSSSSIKVDSLAESKTFEAYFHKVNTEILQKSENPFVAMSYALDSDGIFIRFEENQQAEPLTILNIVTRTDLKNLSSRIYIHCKENAKAKIHLIHQSLGPSIPTNLVTYVHQDKCSEFKLIESIGSKKIGFHQLYAHLKQEAKFNFFEINTSAELYRNEINIYLKEKQSDANLYGLNLMTENHEAHFFANVEHLAEETTSFQQIKNISFDRSRTSFEGKIFVDPIAQQTKAYQLNQNLVLSEKAANFSMPNLQILADDVKASHGATFAKIDEEALFYLQSRGVSLKKAKSLLIKSFVNELVDLIQDEELYTELKKQIDEIVDRYL